jgi:hypothetical protein
MTLQKENNYSYFEGKLEGNYKIDYTITEYKARGQAFSKGGVILWFWHSMSRGYVH